MNKDNDSRKVAIYSRKSKYTGKGESIENQIEMCKRKINYEYSDIDFNNDVLIYEDEGYTGYNMKRPNFQKLLKDIKDNKIKTIVFYKLDRVSRNVNDFSNLLNEFDRYNIKFFSVTENLENSTPTGRAMIMVVSIFAQLERDTIAERIRDNMMELAKTGRWLGGNAPTGYISEAIEKKTIDGKIKKLFKLIFVEEEIKIVKLIFNKFSEYKSLTKVETYLLQNDIKTKQNNTFQRWGIKNILTNPVYANADEEVLSYFKLNNGEIFTPEEEFDGKNGVMAYNKTEKKAIVGTIMKKDIKDWVIAIGKHKGIISGKEWVEVQELLLNNADKKYRQPLKNSALVSGIIKCLNCGSSMLPKVTQRKTSNGDLKFDYICDLKYKSRGIKCQCKNSNGNEVDSLVMDTIRNLTRPDSEFYQAIKKLTISTKIETNDITTEIRTLENTYRKNQTSIENLLDNLKYVDTSLVSDISKQVLELKQKNDEIEIELNVLNKNIPTEINDTETAGLVLKIMDTYIDEFDNLDLVTKRNLIRMFISSIQVDGEKLIINLIGAKDTKNEDTILLGDSSK